jgi:GNAT superfamily N-acetyltransferase
MNGPDGQKEMLLDRAERPFFIFKAGPDELEALMEMYTCFYPRPGSQGLPPSDPAECHLWIEGLVERGINFIATRGHKAPIGHVCLMPDLVRSEAEFMIFVAQADRKLGIGTALALKAIGCATEMGLVRIWLCVSSYNIAAIRLYLKVGFSFKSREKEECLMELWLPASEKRIN